MQYTSTAHNLHSRWHASHPAVSRCDLKLIDPTQVPPGLTHTATGAIMIAPVPDESLRCSSIIGHYNHIETNHNQHCVRILHQSSYSTLIDTPVQHPTNSQNPHWRKMRQQGYQVLKMPHKDLNKGDNLDPGSVPLQRPDAVAILSANGNTAFKGSCAPIGQNYRCRDKALVSWCMK